ncbi:MAG: diguanylate cyclase [Candidatus Sedimenticola endophacoides]
MLAFGSRHEVDVERVFTSGCGDYLVRPYRGAETAARVISQIRLFNLEKDLVERSQELRRLSSVDTLTGLYNRRRFIEQIGQCLSRVDRYGGNCSLLVLDLDHFKRVNAVHGYDVGDEVLTEVARRIRNTLRESDLAARWAGEEFIVLATETALDDTVHLALRLQHRISHESIGAVIDLTASFGVTAYAPGRGSIQSLIGRADAALVTAKESGRNCIRVDSGVAEAL